MTTSQRSSQYLNLDDFEDFDNLFTCPPSASASGSSSSFRLSISSSASISGSGAVISPRDEEGILAEMEVGHVPSGIPLELDWLDEIVNHKPMRAEGWEEDDVRAEMTLTEVDATIDEREIKGDAAAYLVGSPALSEPVSPTLPTYETSTGPIAPGSAILSSRRGSVSVEQVKEGSERVSERGSVNRSESALGEGEHPSSFPSSPAVVSPRPQHGSANPFDDTFETTSPLPDPYPSDQSEMKPRRRQDRPASLAGTLRPRRGSTGGASFDWLSMYNAETPTAIVDLERIAACFPVIPDTFGSHARGDRRSRLSGNEDQEPRNDDGDDLRTRVDGLPCYGDEGMMKRPRGKGLNDKEKREWVSVWTRDCSINSLAAQKDTRRVVSWSTTQLHPIAHTTASPFRSRAFQQYLRSLSGFAFDKQQQSHSPSSPTPGQRRSRAEEGFDTHHFLLRRSTSLPDLRAYREFNSDRAEDSAAWLPRQVFVDKASVVVEDNNNETQKSRMNEDEREYGLQLQEAVAGLDSNYNNNSTLNPLNATYRRSTRLSGHSLASLTASKQYPAQPLPKVPEESSLTEIPTPNKGGQLRPSHNHYLSSAFSIRSGRSEDTSISLPSLSVSNPADASPSTSTSTGLAVLTTSSGDGTFGIRNKLRQNRGPYTPTDRDSNRHSHSVDSRSPGDKQDREAFADSEEQEDGLPTGLGIAGSERGISTKDVSYPTKDLQSHLSPTSRTASVLSPTDYHLSSQGRSFRFPVTPDSSRAGSALFSDSRTFGDHGNNFHQLGYFGRGSGVPSLSRQNSSAGTLLTVEDYGTPKEGSGLYQQHTGNRPRSRSHGGYQVQKGEDQEGNVVISVVEGSKTLVSTGTNTSTPDRSPQERNNRRAIFKGPSHNPTYSNDSSYRRPSHLNRSTSISSTGSRSGTPYAYQDPPLHPSEYKKRRESLNLGETNSNPETSATHPFASRLSPNSTGALTPDILLSPVPGQHHTPRMAATMASGMPQVTLVAKEDMQRADDAVCVICCESLNPLYRLPGERPNVMGVCGHSLHHACFTAVYGPVPTAASTRDLGVCGVCRQPMRIDEEESMGGGGTMRKGGGGSKFATLMGLNSNASGKGAANVGEFGGRIARSPMESPSDSSHTSSGEKVEGFVDDAIEPYNIAPSSTMNNMSAGVVVPVISVRAEHTTIPRRPEPGKRVMSCIVTVQVPSAGKRLMYTPRSRDTPKTSPMPDMAGRRPSIPRSRTLGGPMSARTPITPDSSIPPHSAHSLGPDPFAHVAADLKHRLSDYKSSGLDTLGRIRLFDILQVRKGQYVLDIMVFLYDLALVCVAEDKKKGLKQLLSSSNSNSSLKNSDSKVQKRSKTPLRLKGRVYFRDVSRMVDSSMAGELSATIQMKSSNIDSFILIFKEKSAHALWMNTLNMTLAEVNGTPATPLSPPNTANTANSKLARMGIQDKVVAATQVRKDSVSSAAESANHVDIPLAPIHTPIDLVLVVPVPPSNIPSSSTALKVQLVVSTLSFVCATLGNLDRVCLVAYQHGQDGWIKRTPFLNPTRTESRKRLDGFIASLSTAFRDGNEDDYILPIVKDEKVDVISAVNAALDNVLQRKGKNPVGGMIVVSDAPGIPSRGSMDLVIARLEAASLPIHAIGYTKGHEPSPLWLITNATQGTYVSLANEWNQLRDVCAGILGGLTSVSLMDVKLSLSTKMTDFRIRKVQGSQHSVIASDANSADVDLGHLVSGSKVEVLVDIEREMHGVEEETHGDQDETNSPTHSQGESIERGIRKTAGSWINHEQHGAENHLVQMWEEGAIDDMPVLSVDCQYLDPAAGRQVARLSDPRLLMLSVAGSRQGKQNVVTDIVRRKAELLSSESMTRAVLLVSRNNWHQARRVVAETSKILAFNLSNAMNSTSANGHLATPSAIRREAEARATAHLYQAILEDLDVLGEGCEEEAKDVFDRDHRTHSAQQALILRKQLSWTARTATEQLYIAEGSRELLIISRSWSQR